jgi:hypothetical protein
MKTALNVLILSTIALMVSCGGGGSDVKNQMTGEWTLSSFSGSDGEVALEECDKQTKWNFTQEAADALSDGTETMKLTVTRPDACMKKTYETQWTVAEGKPYVKSLLVESGNNYSNSGLFELGEITANKMVLKTKTNTYTFTK